MNEFEDFMAEGVRAYNDNDYEWALSLRRQAEHVASSSLQIARSRRGQAATLYRIAQRQSDSNSPGLYIDADELVYSSERILDSEAKKGVAEAVRERGASREWMARIMLGQSVYLELDLAPVAIDRPRYDLAQGDYSAALDDLFRSYGSGIDQYRINALPRASSAFSLGGDARTGLRLSFEVLKAASRSETDNENFSRREIIDAKLRSAQKAVGALAVASLVDINRKSALAVAKRFV